MKQRIGPQLLMIIDVFVTESQTIDPLRQHLPDRVLDPIRLPSVKKTRGESRQQVQLFLRFPQQQCAAIGGDTPTIETGHNLTSSASFKTETGLDTLCHKQRPF